VTAAEIGERGDTPSGVEPIDFSAVWPSARARVAGVLKARGLQAADVDDVIQEVAFRALRDPQRFTSDEHLVRWCCRVAMNLHIDAARRQRRFSPNPPPDVPGPQDTAGTVERKMALEVLTAGIAELSPEERRLLLDPQPVDSRREAVRLAVRRHRLRARLASLTEGLAAGIAVLRVKWASRSLSPPAKVSLVALPVVAVLFVAPLTVGSGSASPEGITRSARSIAPPLSGPQKQLSAGSASRSPSASQRANPSATTTPSKWRAVPRALLELNGAGPPVEVTQVRRPSSQATLCVFGHVNACVNRPGPPVPEPNLPPLP
jgi:hypothetical protein